MRSVFLLSVVLLATTPASSNSQSLQDRLDDIEDQMFQLEHDRFMREIERDIRRLPAPTSSNWKYIGKDVDGHTYTINTSTIKKQANGSISFIFHERSDKPMYRNEITYFLKKTAAEVNCRNRSMRYKTSWLYSRGDSLLGTVNYSPEPSQISTNTIWYDLAVYIC